MSDIEERLLDALEENWKLWKERGGPCPQSLITQLLRTHEAMVRGLKAQLGTEEEDPEKLLRILEIQTAHLRRAIVLRTRGLSSG